MNMDSRQSTQQWWHVRFCYANETLGPMMLGNCYIYENNAQKYQEMSVLSECFFNALSSGVLVLTAPFGHIFLDINVGFTNN
ncbi:hypothetical protein [Paeniglutamicibacter antarcticus]|uniref:hypothetical protein n=1 Tax=Paeniglutamicibacter antarcticus TaxID=494023 RepID=UPI001AE23E70